MKGRMSQGGDIALDLQGHRIPDEEAAVGLRIDDLPVLGIDGVHADGDVRFPHAQVDHEPPQRLGPDAPAAHGPDGGDAGIIPAAVLPRLYGLSQFARREGAELMDLDPAPVDHPGILPT